MKTRTWGAIWSRATVVLTVLSALTILPANAASLRGIVQSGGTSSKQPLPNVNVTLYEATTGAPNILGSAISNPSGQFQIDSSKTTTSSIFFLAANIDPTSGVEFVTVLGPTLPASATINELTTVAATYSMAQFYKSGTISGNSFNLQLAAGMNNNIVDPATGASSPVLLTSPNGDESNSLRTTRSLANILAACATRSSTTARLLSLTTPPGGTAPTDTAQAMASLARNPWLNIGMIYLLINLSGAYTPALTTSPDAWTVTVKVNNSGDDTRLFAGPGNLVFDSKGYAWISNNVTQGSRTSCNYMVVLKPNGQPSDGSDGEPVSPVSGGGLLGGGYGMTIDLQGNLWEGNFGWGGDNPTRTGNGSVSEFSPSGVPISGDLGYQGGPLRAQAIAVDPQGNVWIASFGDDSVYVFLGGDPNNSVRSHQYAGSGPFGLALNPDGSAWVTLGGGISGANPSSVIKLALRNGKLYRVLSIKIGKALKGVSSDSKGNAWVASQVDNSLYGIRPDGTLLGKFSGGGIYDPWGATVDSADNIWVSSFGPLQFGNDFTSSRVSQICGVNPASCPPGARVGDGISPPTGYTVPSGGVQVHLHNGCPLYGCDSTVASYSPIMRLTNSLIDQAGNLWALNNWKPNFNIDQVNPGGDGVVIFVGVAPPAVAPR